jgi:hypothetical protein
LPKLPTKPWLADAQPVAPANPSGRLLEFEDKAVGLPSDPGIVNLDRVVVS